MDIAGVFVSAWSLYKRNVGWLIVAGVIAAVVSGVVRPAFRGARRRRRPLRPSVASPAAVRAAAPR